MKKIQTPPRERSRTLGRPIQAIGRQLGSTAIACALSIACSSPRAQPGSSPPVEGSGHPPASAPLGPNVAAAPPHDFVDVAKLEPSIRVDLRYATAHNFTGQVVYPASARCYLRARVARRLQAVQRELMAQGLGLKVFDCYRPLSVQRRFFALVPDERYVANPSKGSRHNRGAAVDLTLVDAAGNEQTMPTAFDDFSERAHRSFMALPAAAIENRARLEAAMVRQGFVPMPTEWWHFDDRESKGDALADVPFDALAQAAAR